MLRYASCTLGFSCEVMLFVAVYLVGNRQIGIIDLPIIAYLPICLFACLPICLFAYLPAALAVRM